MCVNWWYMHVYKLTCLASYIRIGLICIAMCVLCYICSVYGCILEVTSITV